MKKQTKLKLVRKGMRWMSVNTKKKEGSGTEIGNKAVLHYYNAVLLEQGLITQREYRAMKLKIDQLRGARS